jgi:ABC-type uncharacterized transport system involved in gliding motility auxiliary subunit
MANMLPEEKWKLRLVNASFVLLFLVAIGLLQWISREYHLRFDLTRAGRHSLSEASIAVVKKIQGAVRVTAYASERGELRNTIRNLIERYRHHKSDIELTFVDPDSAPDKVRQAGVQYDGEIVIEIGEAADAPSVARGPGLDPIGHAREQLPPQRLSEEHFTNLLQRLARRGERWVIFLAGHGERSPDRQANFDLSVFATELRKRGFQTRSHSLGEHPQLPANVAVLVIAGPRNRLLAGEVREIGNYLERGGNLLWLHDPGPLHGLEKLAERLGVEFHPGTLVDPVSSSLTGHPSAIVVARYGAHPAVRNFGEQTLFISAAGISPQPLPGWKSEVLIDTLPSSWSETGPVEGEVRFDKGRDIRGPLSLGVALSHEAGNEGTTGAEKTGERREQRVMVLGDGDFLSNTFLGNGGNLEFGMSLMNWLSRDDAFVNIPVRTAPDRTLNLSPNQQIAIAVLFLLVLPLGFAITGFTVWWRRRKR